MSRKHYALGALIFITGVVALAPTTGAFAVDFATRCADANVLRCVGFDTTTTLNGTYGDNSGTLPGAANPAIDTSIKASGAGSMKMTVPSNSAANTSGSYFINFSNDLSVQFAGNAEFYVQWRQRFSPEFVTTSYQGSNGFKQIIIGTGDQPGNKLFSSCSSLETVVQNSNQRGFPQMYNSCSGSTSHGAYNPFEQPFPPFDFKMQNARPSPFCLYSQSNTSYFPPVGNCLGYFANEWMTFQIGIKTGPRVNDEFTNSNVKLWIAREGQSSQLVIDWGPYNLTAGNPADNEAYGKLWLLPYQTGKSSSQTHPVAYTWYDELIVSRAKIADADGSANPSPNPPTSLTAN
jgi:hypothetical protein